MVAECENLYENHSVQGTLYISVDSSKFLIKFYDSLKVEVLLDKGSQGDAPLQFDSGGSFTLTDKKSDTAAPWGDYIDLSKLPSYQIQRTSQQVVKAENGQFVPIVPLNLVNPSKAKATGEIEGDGIPDSFCEVKFTDDAFQSKTKKRKISSLQQEIANVNSLSADDLERREPKPTKTKDFSFQYSHEYEDQEACAENLTHVGDGISSIVVLNQEISEEDIEELTTSNTNGSIQAVHGCSDCCKSFGTPQALKDHRKVKAFSEFNCDECCEIFPFKAFLEVHKKSNHGSSGASLVYKDDQYWYSCDACGALVKTLLKLQIHNMTHTGEGYFQCCLCPQKFGEKIDLRQHLKCHKSSGMIRCRWCNKWFVDKSTLAKHKLTCKEIRCHLCDTVFPNKTSRNQHYKDFHPNDILKCEICPYMFSSQEELNTHMVKHSRFKKKQCTLCGLFFSRLKKHMLIHKGPSEITENELFYCDKCPAKFKNQSTFNRHRQNHMGDKPYQCPNCPRTFANCGVLYKHIKRHATLLPYACEVCGENCESIDQLKTHILTHSDDNVLFPCSVCTQSFMYRTSLESHMQLKHPESFSITVTEAESFKAAQEISTVTAFADNANGIMEVVIPGISGLTDGQTPEFEIVIVEKG